MKYLYLSNNEIIGFFAGPQPGIELQENEEIIQVEDDDHRIIEFIQKQEEL